jgi:hypothetical protein
VILRDLFQSDDGGWWQDAGLLDRLVSEKLARDAEAAPHHARAEASGAAYAALDLGTNNCRLLIATPSQGGFRVMDSFSRVVRLGEGLGSSGQLSAASMDRALRTAAAALGVEVLLD